MIAIDGKRRRPKKATTEIWKICVKKTLPDAAQLRQRLWLSGHDAHERQKASLGLRSRRNRAWIGGVVEMKKDGVCMVEWGTPTEIVQAEDCDSLVPAPACGKAKWIWKGRRKVETARRHTRNSGLQSEVDLL